MSERFVEGEGDISGEFVKISKKKGDARKKKDTEKIC